MNTVIPRNSFAQLQEAVNQLGSDPIAQKYANNRCDIKIIKAGVKQTFLSPFTEEKIALVKAAWDTADWCSVRFVWYTQTANEFFYAEKKHTMELTGDIHGSYCFCVPSSGAGSGKGALQAAQIALDQSE